MNQCQICGQTLKEIPAGVSKKTGRAYNAFVACPNKCKQPYGTSINAPSNPPVSPVKPLENHFEPPKATSEPDWDKINGDKRKDIKWMNALNNSCLLISKILKDETYDKTIEKVEFLANYIYNLEPKEEERQTMEQHKIMNEDIPVSDAPEGYVEGTPPPYDTKPF